MAFRRVLRRRAQEEGQGPVAVRAGSFASPSIDDQILAYVARVEEGRLAKPSRCQLCGHSGRLRWHGTYLRTLITLARTHILPIKRFLCACCRRTFAHLPVFVAKFHRYAKGLIRRALRLLKSQTYEAVTDWFVEQGQRYVAVLTLHFWRRKFSPA